MNDPWVIDNSHLVLRLFLSVLLGSLVGFERERKNHAAGLRTHTLVCLGSCLLMMLSMYGFAAYADEPNVRLDPSRLAAQVVTGISFLGAGTILFTGKSITGLTTAASVWVVMAIGLAVGAGFYVPAAVSVVFALLILWGLNIVERRYVNHRLECSFAIIGPSGRMNIDLLRELMDRNGAKLLKVSFNSEEFAAGLSSVDMQKIVLTVLLPHREQLMPIVEEMSRMEGVSTVTAQ